ncbi:hypothetical protein HYX03_03400 [Candidatus Woesearchaeota archaeon]|nr:hypothetical protein [Candidatus Woesearchaeota archaeon]
MAVDIGNAVKREYTQRSSGLYVPDTEIVAPNGKSVQTRYNGLGRRAFLTYVAYAAALVACGPVDREILRQRNPDNPLENSKTAESPDTLWQKIFRQASLYNLEEKLRTGGSDLPSLYDPDLGELRRKELNGYYLLTDKEGNSVIYKYPKDIKNRIVKNAKDILQSLENIVKDFGNGSEFLYLDKEGKLKKGQNTGVLENFANFGKHLLSAFTFGLYVPEGENKPEGAEHLLQLPLGLYRAIFGDIAYGVPKSIGNIANEAISVGINMVQFVPILTVGNSEKAGEKSAKIFDYIHIGSRTLANATPLIGEGWQRTFEIGMHNGIPLPPPAYYLLRDRKSNPDTVEPTYYRKILEILTALGATAVAFLGARNATRKSKGSEDKKPASQDLGSATSEPAAPTPITETPAPAPPTLPGGAPK